MERTHTVAIATFVLARFEPIKHKNRSRWADEQKLVASVDQQFWVNIDHSPASAKSANPASGEGKIIGAASFDTGGLTLQLDGVISYKNLMVYGPDVVSSAMANVLRSGGWAHHYSTRLHVGTQPGGIVGGSDMDLRLSRYLDFTGPSLWRAEREIR